MKKNILYLSIASLLVLGACSEKGKKATDISAAQNNAQAATSQVNEKPAQEKKFLEMQVKQKQSVDNIQKFLLEIKDKDISNEEKVKQARVKFDSINSEMKDFFDNLDITDSDIKEYLSLQDKIVEIQKDLEQEAKNLEQLSNKGKKKLTPEQTKKYSELNFSLAEANRDLTAKKISIDEKFSKSATGATQEYYQITNIMNLEYKEAEKIAKKLEEDQSIKSEEEYSQKLLNEISKIYEKIIEQLNALEIKDPDLQAYKKEALNMTQKKVDLAKKAPEMQEEYTKNNKLSDANQAFMDGLGKANESATRRLDSVLKKLTQ